MRITKVTWAVLVALVVGFGGGGSTQAGNWIVVVETPALPEGSPIEHQRLLVTRAGATGFFASKRIDLLWFSGKEHTFRVIDNGPQLSPTYPALSAALRAHGCIAGCNGGFFGKEHEPLGLMIAEGTTTGSISSGALASGILLNSGKRNPYLLRKAEYGPKYAPTDLLQAGPFLVDQGKVVAGLSPERPARRTFVLHDGKDGFALGLSDALTLAELGEILSTPDFAPGHRIFRALNLDGGSSSGLFWDRGTEASPVQVEPLKTVRNFLGIVPR